MAKAAPKRSIWKLRARKGAKFCLWMLLSFFLVSGSAVLSLKFFNPPTSAVRVQRALSAYREGRSYQPASCTLTLAELGPNVPLAVLATEDQAFKDHHGIDFKQLRLALSNRKKRGASTLTQQLAKNLFLWHGRSYTRKAFELYFAGILELTLSKRRILELYLNNVEFGDHVFGACAGSQRAFGVHPARLSPYQAGLLASTLPNPHRRDAAKPSAQMHRRAAWAVRQMRALGGVKYLAVL